MRVPDDEMLTYPSREAACAALQVHGWTVWVLPNEDGWYAWDVIATHPRCGASPLALVGDGNRPHTHGVLWWWADHVPYRGARTWRISTGGTTKGSPLFGELRRRHHHRRRKA